MIAGPLIGTWRAVQAKKDSQYEKFCRHTDTTPFDRFLADMNASLRRVLDGRTDFRQTYDPFAKSRSASAICLPVAPTPTDTAPSTVPARSSLADPSFTHATVFKRGEEIKRVKSYKAAVLCLKASDPETDAMLREAFRARVERTLLVRSVLETAHTNRDQFPEDYELLFMLHREKCKTSDLTTVPMLEAVKNSCYRCPSKISDSTKVDIHIPSQDKHYQLCAACGTFLKAWHAVCHWTRLTRNELTLEKPRSVAAIASASATNVITVEGTMRQYMTTIPTFLQHYTALYAGEEDPGRDMYTVTDARRFFGVDEFIPPPPQKKKKKRKRDESPQSDAKKRRKHTETREVSSAADVPAPPPRKKKRKERSEDAGGSDLPPPPPRKKRKGEAETNERKRKERSEGESALPPPPPKKRKKKKKE